MRTVQYHSDTYWIYCTQYLDLHIETDTHMNTKDIGRDSLTGVISHALNQSSITISESTSSAGTNTQL